MDVALYAAWDLLVAKIVHQKQHHFSQRQLDSIYGYDIMLQQQKSYACLKQQLGGIHDLLH